MLLPHLAEIVQLGHEHPAGLHLRDLGVADPLHVMVAQLALQHPLGVADAGQPEVADVGFRRHEGDGHLVPDPALLQVAAEDEGELVGRSEAAGARHGTDDGGAGLLDEAPVRSKRVLRMVRRADGLRMARLWAGAGHFLEGQVRPRADDEVVVGHAAAILQFHCVALRVDAHHGLRDEFDALLLERWPDWQRDGLALAPAHRQPRVGGNELEVVHRVDDGDAVLVPERLLQLVGCGHPADACAKNNDMCHVSLLSSNRWTLGDAWVSSRRGFPACAG